MECKDCTEHKALVSELTLKSLESTKASLEVTAMKESIERLEKKMDENLSLIFESIKSVAGDIKVINSALNGDYHSKGWLTRIEEVEVKLREISENKMVEINVLKEQLDKMMPWFNAIKWMVLTVGPVLIIGLLGLAYAVLTHKIKIFF